MRCLLLVSGGKLGEMWSWVPLRGMSSPEGETVLFRKVMVRSGDPPVMGKLGGRVEETLWREARRMERGKIREKGISRVRCSVVSGD